MEIAITAFLFAIGNMDINSGHSIGVMEGTTLMEELDDTPIYT